MIQAQYFATGKVDKEQAADYAKRKGWTLEEAERWLALVLSHVDTVFNVNRFLHNRTDTVDGF